MSRTPRSALSDPAVTALVTLAMLALFLLLRPFVNGPMNDDVSYSRTMEAFARTGHLIYNGWGSPILFPQSVVGALLVHLFGFSFYVLEWFGVVVASLTAGTLYLLARTCGLRRGWALLVVASVTLNPIFLSDAPSFLNDIPSLFLLLTAVIALVKAVQTGGTKETPVSEEAPIKGVDGRWLVVSLVLALLAGSNRQVCWLAFAGALLPVLSAVESRARGKVAGALVGVIVAALLGGFWFNHHPYTIGVDIMPGIRLALQYPNVIFLFIYRLLNMLALLLLPVVLPAAVGVFRVHRPLRWLLIGALAIVSFLPVFNSLGTKNIDVLGERYGLTLYGQYFTQCGVLVGGVPGFENRPLMLSRDAITVLIVAGAMGMVLSGYLLIVWLETLGTVRRERGGLTVAQVAASAGAATTILQIMASLPWYAQLNMFDRYLLLLLPGLLLLHATQAQQTLKTNVGLWRIAVAGALVPLGVFALLGIGFSLEYFAYSRARMTLYRQLLARGIPPTQIDGGFELNADTQIQRAGHVNNENIKNPPGAYDANATGKGLSYQEKLFPVFDARYRLSTEEQPKPASLAEVIRPDPVAVITYDSPIFSPHQRKMWVYRIQPDGGATSDTAPPIPSP